MKRLFVFPILLTTLLLFGADSVEAGRTRIIQNGVHWYINNKITYPGTPAEGLLMNVRMVNATFEDTHRSDFDPDANTNTFLKALPEYIDSGVRAITLCLQGGMPGYEGAVNSAFNSDGTLREEYLKRVKQVIDACDEAGCAVILGLYYQRQDQILKDEEAVRQGVVNAVKWIQSEGFTNVVLEIANEYLHPGFDHAIIKSPEGMAGLIRLAKETGPDLLVSASGMGDGEFAKETAEAADFLLIHYNSTPVEDIPKKIQALKHVGKAIVCNEDDKTGQEAARAAELSVQNGASWGYMNNTVNQYFPLEFKGTADDPAVYTALRRLTSTKIETK